jgi:hypothetical protein
MNNMNISNRIIYKAAGPACPTSGDDDPVAGWELLDSIPDGRTQELMANEAHPLLLPPVFVETQQSADVPTMAYS